MIREEGTVINCLLSRTIRPKGENGDGYQLFIIYRQLGQGKAMPMLGVWEELVSIAGDSKQLMTVPVWTKG